MELKEVYNDLRGIGIAEHDAALLAAGAILDGSETRDSIRKWLSKSNEWTSESLPMATPFTGFSSSGEPRALPHLLRVSSNRFEVAR